MQDRAILLPRSPRRQLGPGTPPDDRIPAPHRPSFREALRFWFKLGWISFGGTAAHIAIMHDELVEKKRWISNGAFLHVLSHCMILPGREAQQLAIYIGWKLLSLLLLQRFKLKIVPLILLGIAFGTRRYFLGV